MNRSLCRLVALGITLPYLLTRAEVKIEEQEVGPTGSAVKYAISPKGLRLATATLKGSRPIILMDGVPGPAFDELIWVKGQQFEHVQQAKYHRGKDTEIKSFGRACGFQ